MAYSLNWTPKANQTLYDLTAFLAEQRPANTVNKFINKVYKAVERLRTNPEMGQIDDSSKGVRRVLIKPYTRLYYVVGKDEIILISFTDTRRNSQTNL